MGRKRLLTILAAVTAAVALQAGPAAAADDCLVLGQDVSLLQLVGLDDTVCVVDQAGELIQGTLEEAADSTEEITEDMTQPVEETVEQVTEAVTGGGGATPTPTPTEPPTSPNPQPKQPPADGGGDDGGTSGDGSGGGSGESDATGGSPAGPQVATSGEAAERDAARDRQLDALRAIRSDLAAGSPADGGVAGQVRPFGGLGTTDDLAAPLVADGELAPGVERPTPQVAPAPEQREAVFATSSPLRDLAEVPVALQLLAAGLVVGAAVVWTIASRELGRGHTTTA